MRRIVGLVLLLLNLLLLIVVTTRERGTEIVPFRRETVRQEAFDDLDTERTGRLAIRGLPHVSQAVFQRYDKDRDGYWTATEFGLAVESEGMIQPPLEPSSSGVEKR